MKIRAKITATMVVIAVVPLLVAMLIIGISASEQATVALEQSYKSKLVAVRDARKAQLQDYFDTIGNQLVAFSNNSMVINSITEFGSAFEDYFTFEPELERDSVEKYYQANFLNKQNNNGSSSITAAELLSAMDENTIHWQYRYLSENPHPAGDKHQLLQASADEVYNQVHQRYHPQFVDFLEKFGFYDIFLIDAQSGNVVYSVYKEVDFATSLNTGPFKDSGLAQVYRKALQANDGEAVVVADFAPYLPSHNQQAAFMGSTIVDFYGNVHGVLVFQMPVDRINSIMTNGANWRDNGLGESGETYLVAADGNARSVSRFLIEDANGYADSLRQAGVDHGLVEQILSVNNSIGLQPIDTAATRAALAGNSGIMEITDYRGQAVLSAYTPLALLGLEWVLLSEIDVAEAYAGVGQLQRVIYGEAAITVVVIALLAVIAGIGIGRMVALPVESFSQLLQRIAQQNDLTLRSELHSQDELGQMAQALNRTLDKINGLVREVSDQAQLVATASEQLNATATMNLEAIDAQKQQTINVAAAMNQMTHTVREVNGHTQQAVTIANSSASEAEQGQQVVDQSAAAVTELAQMLNLCASEAQALAREGASIDSITDVIKGISEQINLLALNAAIEAARVGEQGRGFAVVADEVRSLAQRTQESVTQIDQTIERLRQGTERVVESTSRSQLTVDNGHRCSERATQSLAQIALSVRQIDQFNTQIAVAAEQQQAATEQINSNLTAINDIALQNAAGAEESAASAKSLAETAALLQQQVSQFKVG